MRVLDFSRGSPRSDRKNRRPSICPFVVPQCKTLPSLFLRILCRLLEPDTSVRDSRQTTHEICCLQYRTLFVATAELVEKKDETGMNRTSFSSPTEMFTCCVKASLRRLISDSPFCPCHRCYIKPFCFTFITPCFIAALCSSLLSKNSCTLCQILLHFNKVSSKTSGSNHQRWAVNGRDAHMWPLAPSAGANLLYSHAPPSLPRCSYSHWMCGTSALGGGEKIASCSMWCVASLPWTISVRRFFFSAPLQHVFPIFSNTSFLFLKRKDGAFNVENLFLHIFCYATTVGMCPWEYLHVFVTLTSHIQRKKGRK